MDNEPATRGAAAEARVPENFAVVIAPGGEIMAWSAGARQLLGYAGAEIVGRPVADLLATELPRATLRHMEAGEPWTSAVGLRHRDGYRVPAQLRGTPLALADSEPLWLVTPAPVTYPSGPDVPAEADLWDRALAQLPLPVAIYDRDARFLTCNLVMSRSMGLTPEEMRGRTLWEILPVPPVDEIERLQRQVMRTGEKVFREMAPSRASGEIRDHAWSIFLTPLKDAAGGVQGMSALIIDTTDEFWARRRLAVLNDASVRIGSTLDVTRTAEELADVAVSGFADFVTVDLLESVAPGDEPEPLSPTGPVPSRRAAQRSVLPGCPESVIPPDGREVYPPGSPPSQALLTGQGTRHRASLPDDGVGAVRWTTTAEQSAFVRIEVRHPNGHVAALTNPVILD